MHRVTYIQGPLYINATRVRGVVTERVLVVAHLCYIVGVNK